MPLGSVVPSCDPGGPVSPDARLLTEANRERMQSLVPDVHAQVEFWEKAAMAALQGVARRNDLGAEEKAEQAARLADRMTKQWLRRLQQWSEPSDNG